METPPPMEHAPSPVSGPAPARRRFMLTAWALIPTALLLALNVVYGIDSAYFLNRSSAFASGCVVGSIFRYVPASLLLAWILYRLTRRSRFWATILLTICILLCSLLEAWRWMPVHSINQRTQRALSEPISATFRDFQFEISPGWQSIQSKDDPTKLTLRPNPYTPTHEDCVIYIDTDEKNLDAVRPAPEFLHFPDGRFPATAVVLDGADGISIERPRGSWPNARYVAYVSKNSKIYRIAAGDRNGADVTATYDRILQTWRWVNKP